MKSIPNETELHLQYQQETGKSRPNVNEFEVDETINYTIQNILEQMQNEAPFQQIHDNVEELEVALYKDFPEYLKQEIEIPFTKQFPIEQTLSNYIEWLESKIIL